MLQCNIQKHLLRRNIFFEKNEIFYKNFINTWKYNEIDGLYAGLAVEFRAIFMRKVRSSA